jgi:hypothetical protein
MTTLATSSSPSAFDEIAWLGYLATERELWAADDRLSTKERADLLNRASRLRELQLVALAKPAERMYPAEEMRWDWPESGQKRASETAER